MNNSSARFDSFIQMLQKLAQGYWGLDEESQKHMQMLLGRLLKKGVTVTFGGHFSSGKSTLINAALGRSLLPTLDYPETGAICAISAGERDYVEVLTTNGHRTIDCTTAAIAKEICLTTPTGSLNAVVLQVQQVNIMLANSAIPRGTVWIDSPGINESPEMYERASEAARKGDILFWVLNSRQFLSLSEEEFLSEYIAERGPGSVVFVSNAFLNRDTLEDWQAYHENSFPAHRNKLRYRASMMGFTGQVRPEVISLSARALCSYKRSDFGGREFRDLLNALSNCEQPRIRHTRLLQAAITLRAIAAQIETRLKQEQERVKQAQTVYEQAQQTAERHKKEFAEEVERAGTRFLSDWRTNAHASEKSVILTINSSPLQRDDTYGRNLNDALKKAAAGGVERLLTSIAGAVKLYEQKNLTNADIATIRRMLTPLDAVVYVPNTSPKPVKGAAAIAAGAAIGSFVPIAGHIAGALAGAAIVGVAAYKSYQKALQQDLAATQSNVTSATQQVIASVEGKRAEAIRFIVEHCIAKQNISPPDTGHLRLLEKQFQIVSELANQAETLARGEG